jgi:hypothetical protein
MQGLSKQRALDNLRGRIETLVGLGRWGSVVASLHARISVRRSSDCLADRAQRPAALGRPSTAHPEAIADGRFRLPAPLT